MMEWDSRMQNKHTVQILKSALPFFDVEIGENIDMEGLLQAIRPFVSGKERRMVDMFLQFFQMERMLQMMQVIQSMQQAQNFASEMSGNQEADSEGMFEMLKAMLPPEQLESIDMITAMMSMMQSAGESGEE